MADYRPDWDVRTVQVSREYLDKHPTECSGKELQFVRRFIAMEERLDRVDKFLRGLR